MYLLHTARLFVVDNAYLPIHVGPHRRATTVVQVWHAAGALKRFGVDTTTPLAEPERTFLHRYYDAVVVGGEWRPTTVRRARSGRRSSKVHRARVAADRPFVDEAAMAAARAGILAAYPALAGRRVVLYAPTFRGRGIGKRAALGLDGARLRAALPPDYALVLKTHPNLDPAATPTDGFDVVADPPADVNDFLAADRHPHHRLLVVDLRVRAAAPAAACCSCPTSPTYEQDPGLYLDYRTEMIGTQVLDTDGVIEAISTDRFDLVRYEAFIERHSGPMTAMPAPDSSTQFLDHLRGRLRAR